MKYSEQEKHIETKNFCILGNMLRWENSMIQLSNVSLITEMNYSTIAFPILSIAPIIGGLLLYKISIPACLIAILAGAGWIAWWYVQNEKLKKLILLTIIMNSGEHVCITFNDRAFLDKVINVLEKVMFDGGTGDEKLVINIANNKIGGHSQLLNHLNLT